MRTLCSVCRSILTDEHGVRLSNANFDRETRNLLYFNSRLEHDKSVTWAWCDKCFALLKETDKMTLEELILKLTNWEDADTDLVINQTEEGNIVVRNFEGTVEVVSSHLKEALALFYVEMNKPYVFNGVPQ